MEKEKIEFSDIDKSNPKYTYIGEFYYGTIQGFGIYLFKEENRNIEVAFKDNLPYYNAIYMSEKSFYSDSSSALITYNTNVTTVTDNIIYEGLGAKGYKEDVTITVFNSSYNYQGKAPVKPEEGEPTQIAISKGVLYDLYKLNRNE